MLTYAAARQCSVGLLCLVCNWLGEERRGGREGRKERKEEGRRERNEGDI